MKETKYLAPIFPTLDKKSLHLRLYSDASFASNDDHSLQLGYLIIIADDTKLYHLLAYYSKNSKQVVRSIMAGELFAFLAAFDHAFVIRLNLESVLEQPIRQMMFTDSKQLFDVTTKSSHTTEKRFMIEVTTAREAYDRR